jgi:hypothetical protein
MKEVYMLFDREFMMDKSWHESYEEANLARYICCVKDSIGWEDGVMTPFSSKEEREKYCKTYYSIYKKCD